MAHLTQQAQSLYELFEQAAATYTDQPAMSLIEQLSPISARSLSSAELFAGINRTIDVLRTVSATAKPVVAILLPSTFETQYVLWGAACAGIACPINPLLNTESLAALINRAKADVIVALGPVPGSDIWQKVQQAQTLLERSTPVIACLAPAGEYFFNALWQAASAAPLAPNERPQPLDIAAYFHTGGTTGAPKLACHSHANQLAAACAFARSMGLGPGDSILNGLPMFHVAGSLATALGALACGVHMVLPTPSGLRNPEVIKAHWRIVEQFKLSVTGGIPTSINAMLECPIDADIASLKYFISGGAPIPAALCERVKQLTGRELYQIYGMTECTGVITMPNLNAPSVPGSAGFVSGPIEVKADASGELHVKGPTVFAGYLGIEDSGVVDGWLKTGDLGHVDERGNLFITGRAKDVIIRGGHNIDPAWIEDCLQSHPDVALAAAVGMPDEYAGELPVAFVQLRQGAAADAQTLRDYALSHIAERPAAPKKVFLVDSLPITAVGKIYKVRLRELALEALLAERLPHIATRAYHSPQGQLCVEFCATANEHDDLQSLAKALNFGVTFA